MFDKNLNKLAKFLKENNLTIATAESCTGGLLSSRLTDISGSSDFVKLNFVTYAYEAKETALGVPHETLVKYSAVSYECAKAMAEGLHNRTNCDLALCTTGIAGPTGGSKEKPVGTVFISAFYKGKLLVKDYHLPQKLPRKLMKFMFTQKAIETALELISQQSRQESQDTY